MAITRRLIAAGAPAGTEIVVVPSVNPDALITIWFHQPQGIVRAWGQSVATARRFAALPLYPPTPPSCPGPVPAARIGMWVRAVHEIAVEGVRR